VSETYGAAGVIYELTNAASQLGWITKLQARGYMVYKYNKIEHASFDSDSQDDHGILEKKIDQKYQFDVNLGKQYAERVIATEKVPRLKVTEINFIANRSNALMEAWLTQDVGDFVYIKETTKEVDLWCWIQGVKFSIGPTGLIRFSWIVKDAEPSMVEGTLTGINIEQGTTDTDGIHFGYLPQISGPHILNRSVSLWVNITETKAAPNGHVLWSTGAGEGMNFNIKDSAPAPLNNVSLVWRWGAGADGWWYSDDSTIALATNYHLGFTFGPLDNLATNPIIYIDGVAVTTTEIVAPLGAIGDEVGSNFSIGNMNWTAAIDISTVGLLRDVRTYDVILTPTEMATLHSDGAWGTGVTRGLVHHGPCVKTEDLTYFTDHTLLTTDRLIDNMHRSRGKKSGTVVTRLVP